MQASADAGPLIWHAKTNTLHLLRHYYPEIITPEAVYTETVTHGLENNHPDAQQINQAVAEKWITVHTPNPTTISHIKTTEQQHMINLGTGERQAIALALEHQAVFLTDDEDAYRVAKIHGLDPKGVLYILLRGVKDHQITKTTAKEKLGKMIMEGFWLTPSVIHRFHETIDRL